MNQRIQELIEQATSYLPGRPPYEGLTFDVFDKEKFAELIVKETMQVVANNLPQNIYLDVADEVIKHFGVKE